MRVLLIDDAPDTTFIMCKLLAKLGYEAKAAADADSGLELAYEFQPHVICLDVGLPKMNGYELARQLHADPKLNDPRVIALSGHTPDEKRAAETGIAEYLLKPASITQFVSALHG